MSLRESIDSRQSLKIDEKIIFGGCGGDALKARYASKDTPRAEACFVA